MSNMSFAQADVPERPHGPVGDERVPLPDDQLVPHDYPSEIALVGLAIFDPWSFDIARALVSVNDFFILKHQLIWQLLGEFRDQNLIYNPETIDDAFQHKPILERVDAKDIDYILMRGGFPSQMDIYIKMILIASTRRKTIASGEEIIRLGQSPEHDIDEIVELTHESLDNATQRPEPETSVSFGHAIETTYQASQSALLDASNKEPPELQCGLPEVDAILSKQQFRRGKFYIVAGRPGMGKTDFMLHLMSRFARQGKHVRMFSLEMDTTELAARMVSAITRTPVDDIENGKLTDKGWTDYTQLLEDAAYYTLRIDDTAEISMSQIEARARKHKKKYGLDVVLIDYLQLIAVKTAKNGTREQAIAEISRACKVMARKLNIVLIMGAQLNRKVEERAEKRPMASDLRESGTLEQDADVVIGLYRDEVYYPQSKDKGATEVLFLKNRGGPRSTAKVYYNGACHVFGNLSRKG